MEHIKKVNVPMSLLLLITLKVLLIETSLATTLFGVGLVALFAYQMYLNSKIVKPLDEEVKKQLEMMKNAISGLAMKNNMKAPKEGQKFF